MTTELRLQIEARMHAVGLKLTPQRFAVLDYLIRNHTHPTADQLSAKLNNRFPRASRATIYNTLHALCEAGLVRELYVDGAVARYDALIEPHHHFVCRLCGTLEDVQPAGAGAFPRCNLEAGYCVESYQLVMRGVCASCGRPETKSKNSL